MIKEDLRARAKQLVGFHKCFAPHFGRSGASNVKTIVKIMPFIIFEGCSFSTAQGKSNPCVGPTFQSVSWGNRLP